jgi:hypothetical protein
VLLRRVLRFGLLLVATAAVVAAASVDEDVGDAAALPVLREGLVVVAVVLGELGDDVPGVDEARDVAEDAEEDVDEGVTAAEAAFDPD